MPLERKRIVNYTKPVIQIPSAKNSPVEIKRFPSTKEPAENLERIGVSVEQAAEMLSLSVRSVWVLVKDGRIRHVKFGTRCIVSVQSIREFVDGKSESDSCTEDNFESYDETE